MVIVNKAKLLLKFIEEVINPDHDYNDKHKKGKGSKAWYLSDGDFVKPTHDVLSQEADKKLKPTSIKSGIAMAAQHYAGSGYRNMNSLLRHGKLAYDDPDYGEKETNEKHIKNLKTLTKNPTQHEFYGYRGINMEKAGLAKVKAGSVIHDKGFTSVSLRPQTASYFGKSSKLDKQSRNFRVHVTPGTKGHYVSSHGKIGGKDYVGEAEFVLHPNTKFKVGKTHTTLAGHKFTDLHIHSQED